MNGIVDVYEKYFTDLTSFQFDLYKKKQHSCLVCSTDSTDDGSYGIYSRKSTEKFVINYLEHLKVFGYCCKLAEIFIESIRENGILSSSVKGHWRIKKHIIHQVIIIEHLSNIELDVHRHNFFEKLVKEKKEPEAKKIIEDEFNFNSEVNYEIYEKKE